MRPPTGATGTQVSSSRSLRDRVEDLRAGLAVGDAAVERDPERGPLSRLQGHGQPVRRRGIRAVPVAPPPLPPPQPAARSSRRRRDRAPATASCGRSAASMDATRAAGGAASIGQEDQMPSPTARRRLLAAAAIGASSRSLAATTQAVSAPGDEEPLQVSRVIRASGDLEPSMTLFRSLLGPDNGGGPERQGQRPARDQLGRACPTRSPSPNAYPCDFFNAEVAPRARGAVLTHAGHRRCASAPTPTTPTAPRRASATSTPPTPASSATFSARAPLLAGRQQRRQPDPSACRARARRRSCAASAPSTPASTGRENTAFRVLRPRRAFARDASRSRSAAAGSRSSASSSTSPVVARVRIEYGTGRSGPTTAGVDVAVMDDFIYGEPVAPGSAAQGIWRTARCSSARPPAPGGP